MTWAQRLKCMFKLDVQTCPACGGTVKLIACIEAPAVIVRILAHLSANGYSVEASISSDGARIVYVSEAGNLVRDSASSIGHIFL